MTPSSSSVGTPRGSAVEKELLMCALSQIDQELDRLESKLVASEMTDANFGYRRTVNYDKWFRR